MIYRISEHRAFEWIILVIIVISSIKLAADTYITDSTPAYVKITSQVFGTILTFVFIVESLMKSIALGFFMDKGSYLRESWNILDFLIVVASVLDLILYNINL